MPVETLGDGPNEPDPKGLPEGLHTFLTTTENHTPDRIPENTSENASGDPVMQFVVQTFKQINAMYSSFSLKRKEVHPTSIPNNDDHPIIEPWQSDLEGQVLWPFGVITIPLTLFDYHMRGSKTVTTDFLIVRAPLPYNVILGRSGMRQLGAIASTIHSLLKFSTPTGVAIVRGDMPCKDTCLQVSRKREREPEEATKLASPENKNEKEEVEINPLYPD
ncbi:hypothetical protein Tco_1178984 [Tanacetum coccineum]